MFSVLDPAKLPPSIDHVNTIQGICGADKIREIADRFNIDKNDAEAGWTVLMAHLYEDPDWCKMKKSTPRTFWAHYLTQREFAIMPAIRKVIEVTLSLPIGSADAERAFSIMAHIRNRRRN